jgi:hypothetical protein
MKQVLGITRMVFIGCGGNPVPPPATPDSSASEHANADHAVGIDAVEPFGGMGDITGTGALQFPVLLTTPPGIISSPVALLVNSQCRSNSGKPKSRRPVALRR